jgi:hypothetical protein
VGLMTITTEHLNIVKAAGACDISKQYKPGIEISSVRSDHLLWIENTLPELSLAVSAALCRDSGLNGRMSLALFGYGYGSGYCYGGYGDGYGSGCGYGGYGYSSGSGYGYGKSNEAIADVVLEKNQALVSPTTTRERM